MKNEYLFCFIYIFSTQHKEALKIVLELIN